jgi:alpha-beta hydrolase superfamily lysophospholipase
MPDDNQAGVAADHQGRVAILMPNGGVLPRAGGADAAVFWADWLSRQGYLSFRFDLPGLGDSDRDPASEGIDFQEHCDAGGYAPWLSDIASHIVERFGFSGVVVLAHCSGAVTALFAASANRLIKGLILLDPYFDVRDDGKVQTVVRKWNREVIRGIGGGWKTHPAIHAMCVELLSWARSIYHTARYVRLFVRRKRLPAQANLPLIRSWTQLAAAGVPMLILRSPSFAPKAGSFDYFNYLQRRAPQGRGVNLRQLSSASHAFAERRSRKPVAEYSAEWLKERFPAAESAGFQNRGLGVRGSYSSEQRKCPLGPK